MESDSNRTLPMYIRFGKRMLIIRLFLFDSEWFTEYQCGIDRSFDWLIVFRLVDRLIDWLIVVLKILFSSIEFLHFPSVFVSIFFSGIGFSKCHSGFIAEPDSDLPNFGALGRDRDTDPVISHNLMVQMLMRIRDHSDLLTAMSTFLHEELRRHRLRASEDSAHPHHHPQHRSLYREIFFLTIRALDPDNNNNIDKLAFDKVYKTAFNDLRKDAHLMGILQADDRPLSLTAGWCRQAFRPLQLWSVLSTLRPDMLTIVRCYVSEWKIEWKVFGSLKHLHFMLHVSQECFGDKSIGTTITLCCFPMTSGLCVLLNQSINQSNQSSNQIDQIHSYKSLGKKNTNEDPSKPNKNTDYFWDSQSHQILHFIIDKFPRELYLKDETVIKSFSWTFQVDFWIPTIQYATYSGHSYYEQSEEERLNWQKKNANQLCPSTETIQGCATVESRCQVSTVLI